MFCWYSDKSLWESRFRLGLLWDIFPGLYFRFREFHWLKSTSATYEGNGRCTGCHAYCSKHIVPIAQYSCDRCPISLRSFAAGYDVPCVPSDNVVSFSSSIFICPANPALRSRNCLRFSSSAFFSLTRACKIGDCPVDVEARLPDVDGCRM